LKIEKKTAKYNRENEKMSALTATKSAFSCKLCAQTKKILIFQEKKQISALFHRD
jgi:hypothetical protein